jgi:putative ABC transport system permease protein
MLPAVRGALRAVDASVPIVTLQTRPMFRDANLMLVLLQVGAAVFAAFAGVALFLAVVGIYGVKSYLVSRRTREIGIRVALGAERRDVITMVIREGLVLAGLGLAVGVGLSLLAGPAVRGLLFQGRALDLPVIALAAVTLLASLILASWLPARRATRVPPTIALRTQ